MILDVQAPRMPIKVDLALEVAAAYRTLEQLCFKITLQLMSHASQIQTVLLHVVLVEQIEFSPPLLELRIVVKMSTPVSEPRDVVDVAKHCWLLVPCVKPLPLDAHLPSPVEHVVLVDRRVEVNLAGILHWPPFIPVSWLQRG